MQHSVKVIGVNEFLEFQHVFGKFMIDGLIRLGHDLWVP